jgi:hypothetical protein
LAEDLIPIGALFLMTQHDDKQAAPGAEVTLQVSERTAGLFKGRWLVYVCK